jgi:hypothetical protein
MYLQLVEVTPSLTKVDIGLAGKRMLQVGVAAEFQSNLLVLHDDANNDNKICLSFISILL